MSVGRRATWRLGAVLVAVAVTGVLGLGPPTDYEATARALGELQDRRLAEVSGIAASRRNPGCYYIHNDSGGKPRVFLIDQTGSVRLEIRLKGAGAVDYEDIAVAPGARPGLFDVCIADIGDNRARRAHLMVYRFPEVAVPESGSQTIEVRPRVYRFSYADGPADAEAFCVDPRSGDGYVLTKRTDGRCRVYRLAAPWKREELVVLPRVAEITFPPVPVFARIVTAADISPDGRRLAVRCYVDGWEWRTADAGGSTFERFLRATPLRLPLPAEPQGEALCYAVDGRALLTVSEGRGATLYGLRHAEPPRREEKP